MTTVKIADGAVDEAKIADGAVAEAKIADGAVHTNKISDFAVTNQKIGTESITGEKISNATIAGEKLIIDDTGTVDKYVAVDASGNLIKADGTGSGEIADGSVTTAKLADGAVTDMKLKPGCVHGDLISNWGVAVGKLLSKTRNYQNKIVKTTSVPGYFDFGKINASDINDDAFETWTFTLSDGSSVSKQVVIKS